MKLPDVLDPYSVKARLMPATLTVAPAAIVALSYLQGEGWVPKIASLALVSAAFSFWLADIARNRGKRVEEKLLAQWGVLPSVAMLRHRDSTFNRHETAAHHRAAAPLVEPMPIPSEDEERSDPAEADERYTRINTVARNRTRDANAFALLFKENVSYGFRRNMLGLRPLALGVLAVILIFLAWQAREPLLAAELPEIRECLLMGSSAVLMLAWCLSVNQRSVQRGAREYAKQLLMALETVE